ncbi:MAG: AAA family ATPase [Rhodopila sp.]
MFALAELAASPTLEDYLIAARAFEAVIGGPEPSVPSAEALAVRCRFYSAVSGDKRSANDVAAFAVRLVYSRELSDAAAKAQAAGAVAWLLASTGQGELPSGWSGETAAAFVAHVENDPGPGPRMVDRMMRCRRGAAFDVARPADINSDVATLSDRLSLPSLAMDTAEDDLIAQEWADEQVGAARVIVSGVGNPTSDAGRRLAGEFRELIGEPLPLAPVPNLTLARRELVTKFPHAEAVVDAILAPLFGQSIVKLFPILLVGESGSGKTSFAVALASALGLPSEIYPVGGVCDGSLAGTARRWATAECSLPMSVILTHRHAGPAVVLDELDKAGDGRANGSVWDAIHAFLEPGTARRFRDPLLEAPVDLSHVNWIGTANEAAAIPRSILDRVHVMAFPMPGRQHLERLANSLLVNFALERFLDPRWALPVDGHELAALSSWWAGGSIRALAKMVAAVVQARDLHDARH